MYTLKAIPLLVGLTDSASNAPLAGILEVERPRRINAGINMYHLKVKARVKKPRKDINWQKAITGFLPNLSDKGAIKSCDIELTKPVLPPRTFKAPTKDMELLKVKTKGCQIIMYMRMLIPSKTPCREVIATFLSSLAFSSFSIFTSFNYVTPVIPLLFTIVTSFPFLAKPKVCGVLDFYLDSPVGGVKKYVMGEAS